MSRWKPDARRRLQEAALELYAEQGFAETSVASVAARAGLTERTFFRYFADKREVLFGNESELQDLLVTTVAEAPEDATPWEAVSRGLAAVATHLQPRREAALTRARIIAAHPELRERELSKVSAWSGALEVVLAERGVRSPAVVAEVAVAVFRTAFQRWVSGEEDLPALVREALDDLADVVTGSTSRPHEPGRRSHHR
ncbi:AcrR family transcriptional regulator [Amycolatopsis bartoniae]|uniref:TetR family transcriptional regulator n=1 Tax=Amycolatopsis bartoniae TaxID=941986 RepID=A0A8H9IYQ1_9PSEU|nr:TetR family transcriptional regulator [Amycolatopsis bartoniae]MBB2933755.1 AcrR family transcriptional regulator [Amycolatopsis bartoniae]TVT10580.1 TetR family transcriptional regulator [Amycolatopsis bartoniae]GHF71930.1 TetR family transcriptional regulator [Amycolatopsis bartoniae]